MITYGDYVVQAELLQGREYKVYRAVKEDDARSYIIKVRERHIVQDFHFARFMRDEYDLLHRIDSEYVVKALDWIDLDWHSILVMEDIGGTFLKHELDRAPLPLDIFMEIALEIVDGLAAIHAQSIVHGDINPSNIVWNPQTKRINITNFDMAGKPETDWGSDPKRLEATPSHISPEQTGRIDRGVDRRSDLYSLGVTFYEMLTGRLPFPSGDLMDTVYSHLARIPRPVHTVNEETPGILSQMISKLLAKNPEERYQSAAGLKHDLEQAMETDFAEFRLGERDFSGQFRIRGQLYGREREIGSLMSVYRRIMEGEKEMIVVSGYAGIGKTSLVNEIHLPVIGSRGWFIRGKFDQLRRSIPYFAFAQALDQFCGLLLSEGREALDNWKRNLQEAVGELGKVLIDLAPCLELILGQQPHLPEVGGEEAEARFHYVFKRLLNAMATNEHPLVIFFDDMQWADLASLRLLQTLMEDDRIRHFLFIAAYRDNEVTHSHPLTPFLEEFRKRSFPVKTIPVTNLSQEDVQEWLLGTLNGANADELQELTRLTYKKTLGNPFFTVQFLENLYKQDLLRFDRTHSKWVYDAKLINEQDISDSVVDLLVRRLRALPEGSLNALSYASCIGSVFDLRTLSLISKVAEDKVRSFLELPVCEHFIAPMEGKFYRFEHDRIQQAAYSLVSDEDRKLLHFNIGRLLLAASRQYREKTGARPLDIVNHLNLGIDFIKTEEEKVELCRLNLNAAELTRASAAYEISLDYINQAVRLLSEDSWHRDYDLTLAVYNEAIRIEYLCADFVKMDRLVDIVLQSARTLSDRAIAFENRMVGAQAQNRPDLAQAIFLEICRSMHIDIPPNPELEETMSLLASIQSRLEDQGMDSIPRLPLMTHPQMYLPVRLFANGGATGLAHASQLLLPYVTARLIDLTLEHGLVPESAFLVACYGILRNHLGDVAGAHKLGRIAMALLDVIPGTDVQRPKAMVAVGLYCLGWKEHFKDVANGLTRNYYNGLTVGDVEFACYSIQYAALFLSRTGAPLSEILKRLNEAHQIAKQLKQQVLMNFVLLDCHVISDLLAPQPKPSFLNCHVDDYASNTAEGAAHLVTYNFYIRKAFLAFLFDDDTSISDHIRNAEDTWRNITVPIVFLKSDLYFLMSLIYVRLCTLAETEEERESLLDRAQEQIAVLKQWAAFGPLNYLQKYYISQAELYRVTGQFKLAGEWYDRAIQKAHGNDYINDAALANELAGRFYLENNHPKIAAMYLVEARACWDKWGAVAKVKHLEEKYPAFLGSCVPTAPDFSGSLGRSHPLDTEAILRACNTFASEVHLDGLLKKMMKILIANAGAQRGLFIQRKGERLVIQAEGDGETVSGILQALPVEDSEKVPRSLVDYVARSKQRLVFDNISANVDYLRDPYIKKHRPKSVSCLPVMKSNAVIAIIYLENNLVEGAFSLARLRTLEMLSTQIAISLENAQLYEDQEAKIRQRTKSLEEANRHLELSRQAAEAANQAKSRFLANMSHELRTPLNSIIGFSEIMEDQWVGKLNEKQLEYVKHISSSGHHLLELINDVLNLAKIESGKMELTLERVDLGYLLEDCLSMIGEKAIKHGLTLDFFIADDIAGTSIWADGVRLKQIVLNLLSNAAKFTPGGGTIKLAVQKVGGELRVSVSDTGIGIDVEDQERVFEAFEQLDSSLSRHQDGTGLGLALTRRLVELHGGRIWVESPGAGKGCIFTFAIPCSEVYESPEEEAATSSAETSAAPGRILAVPSYDSYRARVLVIEDNASSMKLARNLLEAGGYLVHEAGSAEEGIRIAVEDPPDLILMDISLPGMDGLTATGILRKEPKTANVPIIALTAHAMPRDRQRARDAGCAAFLTKPIDKVGFYQTLATLLPCRSGAEVA